MNKFIITMINAIAKSARVFSPEDHVIIFLGATLVIPTSWITEDYLSAYFVIMGEAFKWLVPTWAVYKFLVLLKPAGKWIMEITDRKTCVNCKQPNKD